MRRDEERLRDILEAIATVHAHPVGTREDYEADEVKRWFYLKQVEIIGEAGWKLSDALKTAHPEIPWSRISGMRHILVHDYWQVDWDLLWRVLTREIDLLKGQVEAILHGSAEG